MGQTATAPVNSATSNNRSNNGNGASSNTESHANDRRRVTFGGPAAAMRPKSPRQHAVSGMSTRQSWPNLLQQPDSISTSAAEIAGPSSGVTNHLYHVTHGKNIVLSPDRKLATRSGSFCNAIVFTHRPLRMQDPLHLQLIQSTQGWSGVIRFGFTCHCPDRLKPHMLPKYACPDLTVKPGYWVKALRETLAANGNVLSFFVNSRGEVFYSVNGEPYHMFFNGVDVSKPLWALIDVYGNTTGIRIVDEESVPNAFNLPPASGYPHGEILPRGPTTSPSSHSLPPTINASSSESSTQSTTPPQGSLPQRPPLPLLPLQPTQLHPLLERLPFHSVHGSNITFSDGLMFAERKSDAFSGGLVFICRSLKMDEAVFICIKKVSHRYIGHLGAGLTTCDPKVLRDAPIPDDAEHVYDRPEYWVLTREFEQPATNDIMGFVFNSEGEVHLLNADGSSRCCLMFVDTTIPLWLYFDVYGTTQAIQTLGYRSIHIPCTGMTETTADSNTSNLNVVSASEAEGAANTESLAFSLAASLTLSSSSQSTTSKPKPPRPSKPPTRPSAAKTTTSKVPAYPSTTVSEEEECSICFEAGVNAVFYKCGHVCCCYECANKMRGSSCPICRAVITDIIKMYKP